MATVKQLLRVVSSTRSVWYNYRSDNPYEHTGYLMLPQGNDGRVSFLHTREAFEVKRRAAEDA